MSGELRIIAFDESGTAVADNIIDDVSGEGPDFYAHQTLHRNGVVCVEVFGRAEHGQIRAWATVLRQCDQGLDFVTVVGA